MRHYDEQLEKLQQQIARKKRLETQLTELRRQQTMLKQSIEAQEEIKAAEQADVQKLEGLSLTAIFLKITGRFQERLTREQQEAYAAMVKYDAAVKELAVVEQDICSCESELLDYFSCELRYELVLKEKAQAMKQSGSSQATEILQAEQQIKEMENREKELAEAMAAGKTALSRARSVLSSLNSAGNWNTWDLIGGGGVITHIAKHSHLDEAQNKVYALQEALGRFQTELADVSIPSGFQVNIDGFLRFADYFFDGLFADWAVGEQISQSRAQVEGVLYRIQSVLEKVEQLYDVTHRELEKKKIALKELVARQTD